MATFEGTKSTANLTNLGSASQVDQTDTNAMSAAGAETRTLRLSLASWFTPQASVGRSYGQGPSGAATPTAERSALAEDKTNLLDSELTPAPDDSPPRALSRRAALKGWLGRGSVLTLSSQWAQFGAQAGSIIVLAHLIGPQAFGIVTMVTSVVGLASVLGDFGLSLSALASKTLTQAIRSNLFWINLAVGACLTALVGFSSPLLADIYHRPVLTPITLVLASTFLVNAAAVQFTVEINLSQRWRRLALVQGAPSVVAFCVATGIALATHSYWALVAQRLCMSLLTLALAVTLSGWRPSWPSGRQGVGEHVRFGRDTAVVQTLNYVASNSDSFVIGRDLGAAQLGDYGRAYQLAVQPILQIASPLTRVMLPRLRALEDRRERYLQTVRVQRVLVYCQLVPLSFLVGAARPLTILLLGRHWPSVPYLLQIEAIGSASSALGYVLYWTFLVERRTGLMIISEGVCEILMVFGMFLIVRHGTTAVAWVVAAGQFCILIASASLARAKLSLPLGDLFKVTVRPVVGLGCAALIAVLVGSALGNEGAPLLLLGQGSAWLVTAGLLTLTVTPFRHDLRMVRDVITRSNGA